jgi:TonB family protein
MIKPLLAALLGLSPSLACADGLAPPALTQATPVGPHACGHGWYPASAVRASENGDVSVTFRIAADGTVKDVLVVNPSDFPDLDDATVRCVSTFLYNPATRDGKPVEVDRSSRIRWRVTGGHPDIPDMGRLTLPARIDVQDCDGPEKSGGAVSGKAILAYVVGADGTVGSVTVKTSSGDKAFDDYAVACVSKRHYRAATQNGTPIDWLWGAQIAWTP